MPLFASVTPEGLDQINDAIHEVQVLAETAITHEGRLEGYFFIIVEGKVRVERGGRIINTLGPGDFFGEIALLDGGPRTASAIAETPCRLLTMKHSRFHELLDGSPEIRTAVPGAVGGYLRRLDEEAAI